MAKFWPFFQKKHKLSTLERELVAAKSNSPQPKSLLSALWSTQRNTSPRRGDEELLQSYSKVPYVRAVVSKIALACSTSDFTLHSMLYKSKPVEDKKLMWNAQARAAAVRAKKTKELDRHPFLDLLADPNEWMTGSDMLEATFGWLELIGHCGWVIYPAEDGTLSKALPIPGNWIHERPSKERPFYEIQIPASGVQAQIPVDRFWYFRDVNLADPYGRGVGVGTSLATELDIIENATQHVSSFFYNDALPNALVSIKDASPSALEAAKAKFEADYRGVRNAHRLAWTQGDLDIVRIDSSFADMQLNELRLHERNVLLQAFGLSPEMLGILDSSNRATIFEARYMFAENVVTPRVSRFRDQLQRHLRRTYDPRLIVHVEVHMPDNHQYRLEAAQKAPWALSVNEWRHMIGVPDIDEEQGKLHPVPFGIGFTELAVIPNYAPSQTPLAFASGMPEPLPEPEPEPEAPNAESDESEDE